MTLRLKTLVVPVVTEIPWFATLCPGHSKGNK